MAIEKEREKVIQLVFWLEFQLVIPRGIYLMSFFVFVVLENAQVSSINCSRLLVLLFLQLPPQHCTELVEIALSKKAVV